MSRIPTVKLWRVTFADGTTLEILAPTKRLAILNTRLGEGRWAPIRKVGLIRRSA